MVCINGVHESKGRASEEAGCDLRGRSLSCGGFGGMARFFAGHPPGTQSLQKMIGTNASLRLYCLRRQLSNQ